MPHYHLDTHRRAIGWFGSFLVLFVFGAMITGGIGMQHALSRALQRRDGRLAAKSVAGMIVPADYVQFTRGCSFYRCYTSSRSLTSVARDARGILSSAGAKYDPFSPVANDGCDHGGPPLLLQHIPECIDSGTVHHRNVLVFVKQRFAKRADGSLRLTRRTEVDVSFTPTLER